MKLYFCTGNENKRNEVERILNEGEAWAELVSVNIDVPEYQGTAEEIAKQKCSTAYSLLVRQDLIKRGEMLITEDTCLCFQAMHDLPGPYIKWFVTALGNDNLPKLLAGFENKTAFARDYIAYWDGLAGEPIVVMGECQGTLVEPRGPRSFGWDPNFLPDGKDKTFAELPKAEKDLISHRRRALEALKKKIRQEP